MNWPKSHCKPYRKQAQLKLAFEAVLIAISRVHVTVSRNCHMLLTLFRRVAVAVPNLALLGKCASSRLCELTANRVVPIAAVGADPGAGVAFTVVAVGAVDVTALVDQAPVTVASLANFSAVGGASDSTSSHSISTGARVCWCGSRRASR